MDKYNCIKCNYSTNDSGNWSRHKNSNRHFIKVMQDQISKNVVAPGYPENSPNVPDKTEISSNKLICKYCDLELASKSGLSKHKKICAEKKIEDNTMAVKNKLLNQEIIYLKEIIRNLQETTNHAVGANTGDTSLTGMLYGPLKSNPPLKQINNKDLDDYIKPNSMLIKEIMACFRAQTLHEFLGNFILTKVKKKKLEDQSIFSSDTSRQTYYIKELILKNKSSWVLDKQGVRVKKILIRPITDYVYSIVEKYYYKTNINLDSLDLVGKEIFLRERTQVLKLSKDINTGKLDERINKFLCPHLQIDLEKIKKLKSEKHIPTLDFDETSEDESLNLDTIEDIVDINLIDYKNNGKSKKRNKN
mgnify:CR=1 FL=1